jgi:hypothetical protein
MGDATRIEQLDKTWRYKLSSSLGVVTLAHNPEGWADKELTLTRSDTYKSIFRTSSAELEYLNTCLLIGSTYASAYDYLKALEDSEGVLAECKLIVDKKDSLSGTYTEVFSASLNFTEFIESNKINKSIAIPLIEDSFHERLQSRENTDIPYDRPEDIDGETITAGTYTDITFKGREFYTEATGQIWEEDDETGAINNYNMTAAQGYIIRTEFQNVELLPNYQTVIKSKLANVFTISTLNALYYTDNVTATVNYSLNINFSTTSQIYLSFLKASFDEDGVIETPFEYIVPKQLVVSSLNTNYTGTVDLEAQQGIVLLFESAGGGFIPIATIQGGTNIYISAISSFEETPCKVVLPHELFTQQVLAITGKPNFRSNYFGRTDLGYAEDGEGAYITTTNGMLIRQFAPGYIQEENIEPEDKPAQLVYRFKESFESYAKLKSLVPKCKRVHLKERETLNNIMVM